MDSNENNAGTQPIIAWDRYQAWGLLVGFWTLVGLLYGGMGFLAYSLFSEVPDSFSVPWIMLGWYTWVPATLIVWWMARRFPVQQQSWYVAIPLHLVAAVGTSLFASALFTAMKGPAAWAGGEGFAYADYLRGVFARSIALDSIIYLTILAAVHAASYYRESQARRLRMARLRTELTEARLRALKLQLQPHFLFNAFHTVSMLVRQQRNEEAVETLAELGRFLRHVMERDDAQEVTLEEELDFLQSYLSIEHIRFKDRLDVEVEVEPEALKALVPHLLLQPLVENALRHGLTPDEQSGQLRIAAQRDDAHLRLCIQDGGAGLPAGWSSYEQNGLGLANTRGRLEQRYGEGYEMAFSSPEEGGLKIQIIFPYRAEAEVSSGEPAPVR